MELPGRRELREQILHQMDGRTSYVSDADVYREIKKGKNPSALFVTAYGDCYHSTLGCSGLKRTIKAVKLKDVGNLRPCSRCASGR